MTLTEREASAAVLKAMGHPVRLGILELLAESEHTVGQLYEKLGCSQSVMSHQLGVLRNQGLIEMRRRGTSKHCRLRNRDFLRLFGCLRQHVHCVLKVDPESEGGESR